MGRNKTANISRIFSDKRLQNFIFNCVDYNRISGTKHSIILIPMTDYTGYATFSYSLELSRSAGHLYNEANQHYTDLDFVSRMGDYPRNFVRIKEVPY